MKCNLIIITGAPGTGKTSLIEELAKRGQIVIGEPARQILAEQRASGGQGLPEVNPGLFVQLLRERAAELYQKVSSESEFVFFDRGMVDTIVYAQHFGLDDQKETEAAQNIRYNAQVFICPPWAEIYQKDTERRMEFSAVEDFHQSIAASYPKFGYKLIELPKVSVAKRCDYLLSSPFLHSMG